MKILWNNVYTAIVDKPLTNLVNFLEATAEIPVVDRTGLHWSL